MQLSFFHPSSVGSLKADDERVATSVVAFFSRCLVIFLMSLVASVTVCCVDGGGALKALSTFLAASIRNRPLSDTSLMCFSVTLAPLECSTCFMTL